MDRRALRRACQAAALLFAVVGGETGARAFDPSTLEFERSVENVNAPGLYHVEVDPELYRHAHADDLGDLRIAGPDNGEVPWLLRPVPPAQPRQARAVTLIEAPSPTDGSTRAILDLGSAGLPHSEVALSVDGDGDGDWFRQTRLEASNDATAWAPLAQGAYVFRVSVDGRATAHTTIAYPVSDARYLRVTLLAAPSAPPLRLRGAAVAHVPPEAHPPLRLLPALKPEAVATPAELHASEWTLDLGAPGVPIAELALDIADDAFERRALLAAGDHASGDWSPVAATLLYRIAPAVAGTLTQENLRVAAAGTRRRYLRLTVRNDDAAALSLRSASPAYVASELVFRAPAAGSYTLYVGGDVPAPTYDLAGALQRSGEQPKLVATFGTITPNPTFGHLGKPTTAPAPRRRGRTLLVVAVAVLLVAAALGALRRRRRATQGKR